MVQLLNPAAKLDVFYSRIPNSTYIFADGTFAAFTSGRYTTSDPARVEELNNEIKAGHTYIYRDQLKLQLSEAELDPMAEYKARIIAEHEMSKATDLANQRGTSSSGKLSVADSSASAVLAAGSTSGASVVSVAKK